MDITQKSDDWSVLRDAVERRRIQNRVAQRNYRRKRKELLEQQRLETENAPSCRCSVSAPESSSSSSTSTTHGGSSSDGNTNRDSGSSADISCSDYLNSTIYTSPSQHMSQMCLGTNPGSKDQAPFFTPIPNTTSAAHGTNPAGSRESVPFSQYDELQNYSPPCQMQDGSLTFGLVNTSVTLAKHGELGQYEELFEDSWSEDNRQASPALTNNQALALPTSDSRSTDASRDWRPADGLTALHTAAFFAHESIIGMMLDKGADIEGTSAAGLTALHIASLRGCHGVVALLLRRGAYIESRDGAGQTALCLAAREGHGATVQVLLDHRAFLEAVDHRGSTPLHAAVRGGWEEVIQLLLDSGVKVNAKDSSGRTALHLAAENGRDGVVRMLLARGVDIDAKTK
ncbi:Ankyrin-2 [Metarhizium brunneum]|uniref:Ankyrin-2 n=1 Tax=Metarhizium brunneum TaxID=500148 RepID=A0A7D5YSR2_9HYPO